LNCSENKTANLLNATSSKQAKSTIISQLNLNNVNLNKITTTTVKDVKERQKMINHANSKSNGRLEGETSTMRTQQPGLKVRLAPRDGETRAAKASLATPDVTKDILDLEEERFDLVSYINAVTVSFERFFYFPHIKK
jgi:hypothetical protein